MEGKKLNQIQLGEVFVGFFLLKRAECRTTASGDAYLDFLISDATEEVSARLWDCREEERDLYKPQMLVKVKGVMGQWQGKKQIKVDKIRLAREDDEVRGEDFVPVAPEDPAAMYEEVQSYGEKIGQPSLRALAFYFLREKKDRLLVQPAALQNHHAVRGGLLYHTLTMLRAGERLLEVYSHLDRDLLFTGIIIHDIAKIEEIEADSWGMALEYTLEGQLLGHIVQGVKQIAAAAHVVGLDEETEILLEHMVLSHHYEPEFGSPRRPALPEAEMLHYLDILDARMYDMQKALSDTNSGCFSERVWRLHNRRLYKPREKE